MSTLENVPAVDAILGESIHNTPHAKLKHDNIRSRTESHQARGGNNLNNAQIIERYYQFHTFLITLM